MLKVDKDHESRKKMNIMHGSCFTCIVTATFIKITHNIV